MSYNFKPCDRSQMLLLPPSLDEWLPRFLKKSGTGESNSGITFVLLFGYTLVRN